MFRIKKVLFVRRTAEACTLDSKMLPVIAENWTWVIVAASPVTDSTKPA